MSAPPAPTVHATAVAIGPDGVLIRGPSGAGKSMLALTLIERRRAAGGFAALVADDRVTLTASAGRLIATGPADLAGLLEVRGRGILRVESEAATVVRLVVDLVEPDQIVRLPDLDSDRVTIDGIPLPRRRLAQRALELTSVAVERALAGRDTLAALPGAV